MKAYVTLYGLLRVSTPLAKFLVEHFKKYLNDYDEVIDYLVRIDVVSREPRIIYDENFVRVGNGYTIDFGMFYEYDDFDDWFTPEMMRELKNYYENDVMFDVYVFDDKNNVFGSEFVVVNEVDIKSLNNKERRVIVPYFRKSGGSMYLADTFWGLSVEFLLRASPEVVNFIKDSIPSQELDKHYDYFMIHVIAP